MLDTPLRVDKITREKVPYLRLPRTRSRGGNAERRHVGGKVLTIKIIALGACLAVSGMSIAQDKTYTVKQGDSLSGIASKFGSTTKAILHANHLQSPNKLKLGQKLTIPTSGAKKLILTPASGSSYTVQSGDTDESIAKRLGITSKQLRVANLGVKWTNLQIGQTLTVPHQQGWFKSMASHASYQAKLVPMTGSKPVFQLASSTQTVKPVAKVAARTYTARQGDNDTVIAKRFGMTPSALRAMNPGVKWTKLQIGQVVKISGSQVVASTGKVLVQNGPNLPRIKSKYAVVTKSGVYARKGPSKDFKHVAQADRGTRGLILARNGAWYKLRLPKGTEAWVRADTIAPTSAPVVAAKPAKKHAPVVAKRSSTPQKSKAKTTLVASRTNRSTNRSTRSGSRTHAKDNGRPLAYSSGGASLMEKAQSFIGVRYVYGAASRSATDCSGFTTQVFKSQGVKLPRTAREQSGRGQKVGKGELKAGDLVFFKTRGSRVSHVGIYKGEGKFIHASSGRGRVMESNLSDGYYQKRFAGARRVISSKGPAKSTAPKVKAVEKEAPKSIPSEPKTTPAEPKVSPPPAPTDSNGN
jgi:cell wall-associated NlpC family hydrolase